MRLSATGLALAEASLQGAFALSRAIAPTRPDFWDPLGPPAPTPSPSVCIPEVSLVKAARQCTHMSILT